MDIFSSSVKVVDVEDLKKKLLCNPTVAKKCIILELERYSAFRGKESNYVQDIVSVFGEENIEDIEEVSEKLLLVTLHAERAFVADPVRSFRCGFSSMSYQVHSMREIPAYVEAKLSGIPRFVVSVNIQLLVLQIKKTLPFLTDIAIEYNSFNSNTSSSGYYLIRATTKNVADSKAEMDKCVDVPFLGFDGKLELRITGPVKQIPTFIVPAEGRHDISVRTYWTQ